MKCPMLDQSGLLFCTFAVVMQSVALPFLPVTAAAFHRVETSTAVSVPCAVFQKELGNRKKGVRTTELINLL